MNHTEAIKAVMRETGTKQSHLVKQLGVKSQSVISERINHDNISVKAMLEILDAMGYELVVRESYGEYGRCDFPMRLQDYER